MSVLARRMLDRAYRSRVSNAVHSSQGGALDSEVIVHNDRLAMVLVGQLLHQGLDEGVHGDTSTPQHETRRIFSPLDLSVRILGIALHGNGNLIGEDLGDSSILDDIDITSSESFFSEFRDTLRIGVQDVFSALNDLDRHFGSKKFREVLEDVFGHHIGDFGRDFDTSRSSTSNDHGEESLSLFRCGRRQRRDFKVGHDPTSNSLRIRD